jgi:hypothetical protein
LILKKHGFKKREGRKEEGRKEAKKEGRKKEKAGVKLSKSEQNWKQFRFETTSKIYEKNYVFPLFISIY